MSETDPARPMPGELTAADLEQLGTMPLRKSDPLEIGPYRVLARLGGGGMGRLYLGRDEEEDAAYRAQSLVAVKVIRPEYAEDPTFRRRFEREVEAARRVHGTHTAGLLSSGFDDEERLWMATAYVPGLSLADVVRRFGALPAPVVWRLASEIGEALTAIAAAGIVHRDLKPSNVLLGADGVRVIDFGVAHTTDTSSLTMTGQQVGTPAFMSPEQANGQEVGTASDVFSLGSVLALAVTGTAPFGEGSTGDVIHRVIYSAPNESVLVKVAEVDPDLAELISKCLAKKADDRPSPQDIVDAAREHGFATEWPGPAAEVIEVRASWSGPTLAASPMDQLTILRRGRPERVSQKVTRNRRRSLALVGAAIATVVVAAVAAVVFIVPGTGSPQAARPSNSLAGYLGPSSAAPQSSRTSQAPTTDPAQNPPASTGPTAGSTTPASPPSGGGVDGGGGSGSGGSGNLPGGSTPASPSPKQPPKTISPTTKPPPTTSNPQPWKSCNYYSGTALTQYGDKGERVLEVQCILNARGYNIGPSGVDGDFGSDTRAAVKRFQGSHHLQVDGQVGVQTWPALRG